MRAVLACAGEVTRQTASAIRAVDQFGGNSGGQQPRDALPGGTRIGIAAADHRPRDAAGHDQISASGSARAGVGARFQRDVERGPGGVCAGGGERLSLGMGPPAGLRPAARDHPAMLDDQRGDGRIGPR